VAVSDLYIPTIGLPLLLQENMWTDLGIYKSPTDSVQETRFFTKKYFAVLLFKISAWLFHHGVL
jgi:hypothetical protein